MAPLSTCTLFIMSGSVGGGSVSIVATDPSVQNQTMFCVGWRGEHTLVQNPEGRVKVFITILKKERNFIHDNYVDMALTALTVDARVNSENNPKEKKAM